MNTRAVQNFGSAPLLPRYGQWFGSWGADGKGRWWRDPTPETRTDRHRSLRTFPLNAGTPSGYTYDQLELLIQESSFFSFWKSYRVVMAPCPHGNILEDSKQVIVLVSGMINFQIAVNLLVCLARVHFSVLGDLSRYFAEANINVGSGFVCPRGEWPPRTDRIAEDTSVYNEREFKRLSTPFVLDKDLEADIVSPLESPDTIAHSDHLFYNSRFSVTGWVATW
jgi:hypothetical protein